MRFDNAVAGLKMAGAMWRGMRVADWRMEEGTERVLESGL